MTTAGSRCEAFFLPADPGSRLCLFYPSQGSIKRGAVVYVHPFAEEMNKSRRMAAVQARALAQVGWAVFQMDLYGCGDSSGSFADALWEIWKRDIRVAADWLTERGYATLHLWGLRLGALLGLEAWTDSPDRYVSAVLWQPVVDGHSFITQFLRLAVARTALRKSENGVTTETLRTVLASGRTIEVAGYELSPQLVASVDKQGLGQWAVAGARVHWLDVRSTASIVHAAQPVVDAWRANGVRVAYRAVQGEPFWSSALEILEVPELIEATTPLFSQT